MHIRFGTMARLFLTNITPKSEKADIDVEHEPEHARDKENVDDVKNLEKDVEDATTEVKPKEELAADVEESEEKLEKEEKIKSNGETDVPAKPEDVSTKEDAAKIHQTMVGHIGREEFIEPTPSTDDATESNKEAVGVWTAEEEDVPKKAPAKESVGEEEDNPAQLKEEGKEDGSSTDDIVGEDIIENEIDTNYLYFVVYRPNKSIEDTSD